MEVDQSCYVLLLQEVEIMNECMKDIMDSLKYQAILARIVMPLVQRLKMMINGLSCGTEDTNPKVNIQICLVQGSDIKCS